MWAAASESLDVLIQLLQHGADADATDKVRAARQRRVGALLESARA